MTPCPSGRRRPSPTRTCGPRKLRRSDELPEGDIDEGDVTEEWTVKQLKAYAKAENIDLGDAKNKAEILAKLAK
jgi:hypothetical protein